MSGLRAISILVGSFFVMLLVAGGGGAPSRVDAAEQTVTVSWGPFTVPAAGPGGPGSTNNAYRLGVQLPCSDCYVTEIVPDLVDGDGMSMNMMTGGMLHHMVLFNGSRTDATCSTGYLALLGERIFAAGNERSVLSLPPGYGYYNGPSDSWNIIVDAMNFTSTQQQVYLEFTFTYLPGSDSVKPLKPVWLDVGNCGVSAYPINAGYTDTHWDWTSNLQGDVVVIGGHVHDAGISVAAENVGQGTYFCPSIAGYDEDSMMAPAPTSAGDLGHPGEANMLLPGEPDYDGSIEDMTGCTPYYRIQVGDTIRLHSRYNTPMPIDDVMGIMVAYVHPTSDPPLSSSDTDGDGVSDADEMACGSIAVGPTVRPERVDGQYAGDNEDGDWAMDEALPGGSDGADCDGDGFDGDSEAHLYGGAQDRDQDPCGDDGWPLDRHPGDELLPSVNRVTAQDFNSFLAPVRYLEQDLGDSPGNERWDLMPGPGMLGSDINAQDINALLGGATAGPPMLGGVRALDGPACPWPP